MSELNMEHPDDVVLMTCCPATGETSESLLHVRTVWPDLQIKLMGSHLILASAVCPCGFVLTGQLSKQQW